LGKNQDYFYITKFQLEGLAHNHELIWVKDVLQFGIFMNEGKFLLINI
jgi:hypothetical protein